MEERISKNQRGKIDRIASRKDSKIKKIVKEKTLKAIEKFNEIRVPEAKAELLEFKDKEFLIKFSGHMCFTCGAYDYFDDLKFELEDLGIKTKIEDFKRVNDEYLVKYKSLKRSS